MHPYNQVIRLPVMEDKYLSKEVVKRYAKKQNCPPLHTNLPSGMFEFIARAENHNVFMFKYKNTQPCSGISKGLPPPIYKDIDLPIPSEDLRGLASSYLYMRDHKYVIQPNANEGKVSVTT